MGQPATEGGIVTPKVFLVAGGVPEAGPCRPTSTHVFLQTLRPVWCECGWCGKVGELETPARSEAWDDFGDRLGADFPGCPRCGSDEGLHRDD